MSDSRDDTISSTAKAASPRRRPPQAEGIEPAETTPTFLRPKPSRRTAFSDRLTALRYWAARTFTLESIWSSFKTFLWVGPLTVLIWIYAERAQSTAQKNVTIPIAFKSSDLNCVVNWQTRERAITATLEGPKAGVDAVQTALKQPNDFAVQIELNRASFPPSPDQPYRITTAQFIGQQELFARWGVTIADVDPSQINVVVDEIKEIDFPIRLPPEITNISTAVFEPAKVHVTGPRSVLQDKSRPLTFTADLAGREELNTAGTKDLPTVAVRCNVDDPSLTFSPKTVKARLEVSQQNETFEIPAVAIASIMPATLNGKYRVVFTGGQTLKNVKVTGPSDLIDAIRTNRTIPRALLDITQDDVGKPTQTRAAKLDNQGDGVYVTKESADQMLVNFKLESLADQ